MLSPPTEGCIEGCLGNAWSAKVYTEEEDQYSLIFVAYLLFYLAKNHCFIDGNKRVAWMAAMDVLMRYNLTINATDDEAVQFVLDIVENKISDGNKVADWLADRVIALSDF
jgi:death-on-curing protein